MVKKSTSSKNKKAGSKTPQGSQLLAVAGKPWFRPVVLLLLALVIGAIVFLAQGHAQSGDARQVADAFAAAYEKCDLQAAQKYYLQLQTDPQKAADFKKSCVPGQAHLTFDRKTSSPNDQNASFVYDFSQNGKPVRQVMIYLIYIPDDKAWHIFSLTGLPTAESLQNSSAQ